MRYLAATVLCFCLARAVFCLSNGIVQLSAFPSIAVSDGHTPVEIDAEVRDSNGKLVPDGTPVMFSTTAGTFQSPLVTTSNGIAHARLIASSIPGDVKITASAVAYGATATLDYQFVANQALLSKAKEFIQVSGEQTLTYSFDQKIVEAEGSKKLARLKYRDIEIDAARLQFDINNYAVRAHQADVRIGKQTKHYGDLYFVLDKREGYGTTNFMKRQEGVSPSGRFFKFVLTDKMAETYGIAHVEGSVASQPAGPVDNGVFRFDDFATTSTVILAKSVTAFPKKRIIFQGATVYVGKVKVMKVALYQLDLTGPPRLFTDEILTVNNSQVSFNYPYYLSLGPTTTSLFRLETGAADSSGVIADRGLFLNYEYSWNKQDQEQGGFSLDGIARNDWGLKGTDSWHLDNGASISTMLELPSHQSLYGSFNATDPLKGYLLSLSATDGHTFTGTPFDTQDYNLTLEKNPFKIGNLPATFNVGIEAFSTSSESVGFFSDPTNELAPLLQQKITDSQTAYGPEFRGQTQTLHITPSTSMVASFSMAKLDGHNTLNGLTYDGNLSFSRSFGKDLSAMLGYSYTEDGFTSALLGRQQLNIQSTLHHGNASLDLLGLQGLDQDHNSYMLEASYRFSKLWRLGYAFQADRYLGSSYSDFDVVLGFKVGYKEFGIVWSQRLRRFGFQLLGTSFN